MKRACPLSWERSGWAGISNLSVFVALHNLNAMTSGFDEIFTSLRQEAGSLRVRRLCGQILGKNLLQLGHCKPQRDEEGSLGSLRAGPHHPQRPTFQHCDTSSYCFTVWTTVVQRWWDRKHLLWLLLKTIYMIFIKFSSLFFSLWFQEYLGHGRLQMRICWINKQHQLCQQLNVTVSKLSQVFDFSMSKMS